jgi:hypothetical protein
MVLNFIKKLKTQSSITAENNLYGGKSRGLSAETEFCPPLPNCQRA